MSNQTKAPLPSSDVRSQPNSDEKRRIEAKRPWIARVFLVVFVVVGVLLFRNVVTSDASVRFEIGPVVYGVAGNAPMGDIVQLDATYLNTDGERVGETTIALPDGFTSPVSPSTRVRVPAGRYIVLAKLTARDGKVFERAGRLVVGDDERDIRVRLAR